MRKIMISFMLLFLMVSCQARDNSQPQEPKQAVSVEQQPSENIQGQNPELAGELIAFGMPVPMSNYYFALRVAAMFGTPWAGIPNNEEELENRTWNDLLMSFEAFRRNITVTQEELTAEIDKELKGYKVTFDWQKDKDAYVEWAQKTLGEVPEVFENQMKHLIQLKRLHQQILDSIEPTVTEEEAFQEFLNEYNTLSIELIQFDELDKAEEFYKSAKEDNKFWDKEKEGKPDSFKRPGFVALEFLMYMWKLPKEAVYDMIGMEIGSIYHPAPIYKGYGVFKVLEIRKADEKEFPNRREYYFNQLKVQKKYEGFNKWLESFRKESGLKIFAKLPEGLFKKEENK